MDAVINHYEILQVSPHACKEVIEAAYRALQKQFHPDTGGNEELARALNQARECLLDQTARNRYDMHLRVGQTRNGQSDQTAPSQSTTTGAKVIERTYVVCLNCRTRNLVDFDAIDESTCFACRVNFGIDKSLRDGG